MAEVERAQSASGPSTYSGDRLDRIAFPLGGLGAGMICLEGNAALSHFSLHHAPELNNEPLVFAAVSVLGPERRARILEGQLPAWKLFPGGPGAAGLSPHGGMPRFRRAAFTGRFPFASVKLEDDAMPIGVEVTAWSPFEPGDPDNSSLPVAALEYTFVNNDTKPVEAVFSFNAANFMAAHHIFAPMTGSAIRPIVRGFALHGARSDDKPWERGTFAVCVDTDDVKVNHAWHRSYFADPIRMAWRDVEAGACYDRPPVTEGSPAQGASLFAPFTLAPGGEKTIVVRLAWHVPQSNLSIPGGIDFGRSPADGPKYAPWYAGRFADIDAVIAHWQQEYSGLRQASLRFSDCLFSTSLPAEVVEAVAANLSILKAPTMLRQRDGRLWAWEGCNDNEGSCPGSCTHVWNYAQAVAHLFPTLERGLRETEFGVNQDEMGHQTFRTPLPIGPAREHRFAAAADGQLGGLLKAYRDWRISGDNEWLRAWWPKIRDSLEYCINAWDPHRRGWLEEPHHTTYDNALWGPNGMCTSIYAGALKAAGIMARALGEDSSDYETLLNKTVRKLEGELFNGDYFFQIVKWRDLKARYPEDSEWVWSPSPDMPPFLASPEALQLVDQEGPPYQYGKGCLADGVIGEWFALMSGLAPFLGEDLVKRHLQSVYKFNFRRDLSNHANPMRCGFACGAEGGLIMCTWPRGDEPALPAVFSSEVWTGVEYQVAAHMISLGMVEQGLDLIRTCRSRYDGRMRNPFDEVEAGHWYARALASYGLLQALSGARYDAVEQTLYLRPAIPGDFACFLATAGGYGLVGVRDGKAFFDVVSGAVPVRQVRYEPNPTA